MTLIAIAPAVLDREAFVARYGGVYEHSPWIAERAFDAGLIENATTVEDLAALLRTQVEASDAEQQLALLRAHPDLAGKLGIADALTEASANEQAEAGLDACTAKEFERFQILNRVYKEQFGFPFIFAVTGYSRKTILEIFERRVENDRETEFGEALKQVHRIALLRLKALVREKENS